MLRAYAELTVKVGLNLQPRQRLLIIGPVANGGCSLEAAPFVRQITAAAYDAGAQLVETLWGDEALLAARLTHAPRDSFDDFSAWLPTALLEHVEAGHAVLSIYANDPDQLKAFAPDCRVGAAAGDRARRPPVPGADLAQPDELGGRRRRGGGVGRARLSGSAAGGTGDRAVERDRAVVPARPTGSDRGLGDAPRRARRAHRSPERQAIHRAALHGAGHRADHRTAAGPRLGRRTIGQRGGHPLRAEPADRGSVHDAAQGSRRRHRALHQAAQLRRDADRRLQPAPSPKGASST